MKRNSFFVVVILATSCLCISSCCSDRALVRVLSDAELYAYGMAAKEMGQHHRAYLYFKRLTREYPDSAFTKLVSGARNYPLDSLQDGQTNSPASDGKQ